MNLSLSSSCTKPKTHPLAWLNSAYCGSFFDGADVPCVEYDSQCLLQFCSLYKLWTLSWNRYLLMNSIILSKCEVTDQQDKSVPVDNELVFQHFFCQICPDCCCKRTWKKEMISGLYLVLTLAASCVDVSIPFRHSF